MTTYLPLPLSLSSGLSCFASSELPRRCGACRSAWAWLRLGLSPFDLRLRSRLLHRSIYARLGNHRGIRPRSLVHLRRSVVPTQLSAGFRHDRRSRKSHSGRREFLGARFGWRTHRAGFQRLPLLTESLDVLRLLSKPLSLDLIHLLESQLAVSVPAQIVKQRGDPGKSCS